MNTECLKNKVLPEEIEEIGYCDCCYDSDVKITVCPSNNKCEYSLCDKCMSNIKHKTKSNKCPACREEIINIKNINLDEPDSLEIERNEPTWHINLPCCICVLDYPRPIRFSTRSIVYCSYLQHICCCIYNQLNKNYGRKKAFSLTILIHIACILVGRIIYSEFYGETTPEEFWCIWYLFLGKAVIGFCIGLCLAIASIFVIGCFYDCCCREDD